MNILEALDAAIEAALAGGRTVTGLRLPDSVQLVWQELGRFTRRVSRADVPALLTQEHAPTALVARTIVSIAGVHDGRTIVLLRTTPNAAERERPFTVGGVTRPQRFLPDGKFDWDSAITWADLEVTGAEALAECDRSS